MNLPDHLVHQVGTFLYCSERENLRLSCNGVNLALNYCESEVGTAEHREHCTEHRLKYISRMLSRLSTCKLEIEGLEEKEKRLISDLKDKKKSQGAVNAIAGLFGKTDLDNEVEELKESIDLTRNSLIEEKKIGEELVLGCGFSFQDLIDRKVSIKDLEYSCNFGKVFGEIFGSYSEYENLPVLEFNEELQALAEKNRNSERIEYLRPSHMSHNFMKGVCPQGRSFLAIKDIGKDKIFVGTSRFDDQYIEDYPIFVLTETGDKTWSSSTRGDFRIPDEGTENGHYRITTAIQSAVPIRNGEIMRVTSPTSINRDFFDELKKVVDVIKNDLNKGCEAEAAAAGDESIIGHHDFKISDSQIFVNISLYCCLLMYFQLFPLNKI